MRIYYCGQAKNGETEELFVEAKLDQTYGRVNPHVALDEHGRTWIEMQNDKWVTGGRPQSRGGFDRHSPAYFLPQTAIRVKA